jgi:hypothetical protein
MLTEMTMKADALHGAYRHAVRALNEAAPFLDYHGRERMRAAVNTAWSAYSAARDAQLDQQDRMFAGYTDSLKEV